MKNVTPPVPAAEALARLRAGNARFVDHVRSVEAMSSSARRAELVAGQSPFAIVLSCSDSRAPSEFIFDCGLGDLFVVRVAGNVVAPSVVGSVEFAAAKFGTRLVVVMGHTECGAVKAAAESIRAGSSSPSENIRDIVERITPGIADVVRRGDDGPETMRAAMRANVRVAASHLRHGSRVLEHCAAHGQLLVVGADYSLETGVVDFFDGVPETAA